MVRMWVIYLCLGGLRRATQAFATKPKTNAEINETSADAISPNPPHRLPILDRLGASRRSSLRPQLVPRASPVRPQFVLSSSPDRPQGVRFRSPWDPLCASRSQIVCRQIVSEFVPKPVPIPIYDASAVVCLAVAAQSRRGTRRGHGSAMVPPSRAPHLSH